MAIPAAEKWARRDCSTAQRHQTLLREWSPSALGLAVAVATAFPWTGKGWFLALDWVHGPHPANPPGFGWSATDQVSFPVAELLNGVAWLIGGATVAWLLVVVAMVLATTTIGAIVPGGTVARLVGALLYVVNPFVWDRIYAGQMYVVLAYALLPLVVRSLVRSEGGEGWARWAGGGWVALDGAISVHFLWISAVVVIAILAWRHNRRALSWAIGVALAVAVLDAYIILPEMLQRVTVAVGSNDLTAFRTSSDPRFGLYLNVAGLYGFWRVVPFVPKSYVAAWPVLAVAFVLVATKGIVDGTRRTRDDILLPVLGLGAILGFFLALGAQGPTGWIFRFMYAHVPGFGIMREPEKFSALLALGLAVGVGLGVESLQARRGMRTRFAVTGLAIVSILAYTPTLFGGLDGRIGTSHYPADWALANRLMGKGPGRVLALPLHDYIGFSFTGGRVIANPAPQVFDRDTLVGGQIEAQSLRSDSLSPEDAYLEDLVVDGPHLTSLGHLVAQLGVRYVILFKTADYQTYNWLGHQTDLRLVNSSPDIAVYRNDSALPSGARLTSVATVPTVACYIRVAQQVDLTGSAVAIRPGVPCPNPAEIPRGEAVSDVQRPSAESYRAAAGPPGAIVIPQAADGTWKDKSGRGITLADGVQGFETGGEPMTISYWRWWAAPLGDLVSLVTMVALWGAIGLTKLRRRSPGVPASGPETHPAAHEYRGQP